MNWQNLTSITDPFMQGEDIHGVPGLVNLFGIESPGLTSSMAIAEHIVARYSRWSKGMLWSLNSEKKRTRPPYSHWKSNILIFFIRLVLFCILLLSLMTFALFYSTFCQAWSLIYWFWDFVPKRPRRKKRLIPPTEQMLKN